MTDQADPAPSPDLFVLGDSISIHYGPYLARYLPPDITYERKGQTAAMRPDDVDDADTNANGGDSALALAYLTQRYADPGFRPAYVLLNCGLHDIKTDPQSGAQQGPPDQYHQSLIALLALARQHNTRLIWVHTTPVEDVTHNTREVTFQRFDADVQARNRIAASVFGPAGCPIIDLYGFTNRIDADRYCDHVHFVEWVRELQGAYIAGHVTAYLATARTAPDPKSGQS